MSPLCYKVCYTKKDGNKLKVYLVTDTLDNALWHIRWYESHSPPIADVKLRVLPVYSKKNTHDYGKAAPFKAVFPFHHKEIL